MQSDTEIGAVRHRGRRGPTLHWLWCRLYFTSIYPSGFVLLMLSATCDPLLLHTFRLPGRFESKRSVGHQLFFNRISVRKLIQINIKGPVIGGVRCFFEMFDPIIPHHGARLVGKRIKSSGILTNDGQSDVCSGLLSGWLAFRFPRCPSPTDKMPE